MRDPLATVLAVLLAVAGAGALAGCGSPEDGIVRIEPTRIPKTGVPGGRNQIDLDFAQMMVVHHRQAVAIADLAETRTDDAAVLAVAEEVIADHEPEIAAIETLLAAWGEEVPDDIDVSGMDHSTMDHESIGLGFMSGMATDEKLALLGAAQDTAFDKPFLKVLQLHLGGGVAMAQAEQWYGGDADAIVMAKSMERGQERLMSDIADVLKVV